MDKTSRKIFPPLQVWFILVLVIDCLFVWIYFTEKSNWITENEHRQSYISNRFQEAGAKPVVLIIGTSLVEAGIGRSDSLRSCIQENAGRLIQVVKVWKPAATLSSFATEMPLLRQLHPDLVVVEANMLFYRGVEEPFLSRYMQTFRDLLAFKNTRKPYDPDTRHIFRPLGNLSIDDIRGGLVDTADLSAFRELAAQWQSSGTRFLLLNFPIENNLETRKWNSPDTISFFRNLNYLKEKIAFTYERSSLALDSSYYFDEAHLNARGNRVFSSFFCRSVAAQIKKR